MQTMTASVADPGFSRGEVDLTERYRKYPRQNRLSDSFVPFYNFKEGGG